MRDGEHPRIRVGVWIDHRQATVVRFAGDGAPTVSRIQSDVEARRRSRGGASNPDHPRVGGVSHPRAAHRRVNQKPCFIEQVVSAIRSAEEIAIVGPGFAKHELQRALLRGPTGATVTAEAALQMTEPQLIARFKESFDR